MYVYAHTQTQRDVSLWTPRFSLLDAQQPWSCSGEQIVKWYSADGSINQKILLQCKARKKPIICVKFLMILFDHESDLEFAA